jgi:hypothetical protein
MDVFRTTSIKNCIYGWGNVMPDAGCRDEGYRNEGSRTSNARPMGTETSDAGMNSVRKLTNETVQGGRYRWHAIITGPCTVGCAVATVQYGTVVWYHTN